MSEFEDNMISNLTEHFKQWFDDDEFVSDWIIVCGSRKFNGGGGTYFMSNNTPPWAAEGMLRRGIDMIPHPVEESD